MDDAFRGGVRARGVQVERNAIVTREVIERAGRNDHQLRIGAGDGCRGRGNSSITADSRDPSRASFDCCLNGLCYLIGRNVANVKTPGLSQRAIYFLDAPNKVVVQMTRDGGELARYPLPSNLPEPSAFYVSEGLRTIYSVHGSKVVATELRA